MPAIQQSVTEAESLIGADPSEMVFILSQEKFIQNKFQVTSFLRKVFPAISVKFQREFEGMESCVVISLVNGSLRDCPSILPLSLTRANSHLVIFCEDFRGILKDALDKRLVHASGPRESHAGDDSLAIGGEVQPGVKEAARMVIEKAEGLTMEEIESLAGEWGLGESYVDLVNLAGSRRSILKGLVDKYLEGNTRMDLGQFLDSLVCTRLKGTITSKLKVNMNIVKDELIAKIDTGHLQLAEQLELADQLGHRELFNLLTRPMDAGLDAISDQKALIQCVNVWAEGTTKIPTSEDLFQKLTKCGLSGMVAQARELLPRQGGGEQLVSEISLRTAALDIFPAAAANIVTIILAIILCLNQLLSVTAMLIMILWTPASFVFAVHLHKNYNFFKTAIKKKTAILIVMGMPLSGSIIQLNHMMNDITGEEIVQNVRTKKIHTLAKAANVANNLTSFGVSTFCLSLLNLGLVPSSLGVLTTMCWMTVTLQVACLVITSTREDKSIASLRSFYAVIVITTTIMKMSSLVVFFSADTNYLSLAALSLPLLILVITFNYWLEVSYSRGTSRDHNCSLLQAVNCLLHPLPAGNNGTASQTLTPILIGVQLFLNNVVIVVISFTPVITSGIKSELFMTENLVKVAFFNSVAYICLAQMIHLVLSHLTKTPSHFQENQAELTEENTDDERPLTGETRSAMVKATKKASWTILPLVLFFLATSMSSYMLLYQFNTCPAHGPYDKGTIFCSSTKLSVGSTCQLACLATYLSPAPLSARCTWRGLWSRRFEGCRPQVALLLGSDDGKMSMEIYPRTNSTKAPLPPPPTYLQGYTASYVDGAVLVCGGISLDSPVSKTCYRLEPPLPVWEESPDLWKVS